MNPTAWTKSPNVVVLPVSGGGYGLFERARNTRRTLTKPEAEAWDRWDPERLPIDALAAEGFVLPPGVSESVAPGDGDAIRLRPAGAAAKAYAETPDLNIVFNTRGMTQKNPLLALGPYGSLVWRAAAAGRSIGEMRAEAVRVFGCDEVRPFARRLIELGFVEADGDLPDGGGRDESAVKEFPAPEVQFLLPQARIPWYCLWELCTVCDLRCRICYLPQFRDPGPTRAEAQRIVEQLSSAGIFYVGLLGGEVLLRDDLEEIVTALRGAGIFVKIITNGQRLTEARAASLARAGLNQIEVSFDGLADAMHEASRGKGTFSRAREALVHARDAGIPRLGMVLTVHADNVDELDEVPPFMERFGVTDCYVSSFKKVGLLGARSAYEPLGPAARARLAAKLAELRAGSAPGVAITLLSECSCARTSIVIGANQQMRLCTFEDDHVVGDVRRHSVMDLWRALTEETATPGPLGFCRSSCA
jgi:MoaA/NifB/PqqE/SkfB family radical SAM enzyme